MLWPAPPLSDCCSLLQLSEKAHLHLAVPGMPVDAFVYTLHRLAAILQHDTAEALYLRTQSKHYPYSNSSSTDKRFPLCTEVSS